MTTTKKTVFPRPEDIEVWDDEEVMDRAVAWVAERVQGSLRSAGARGNPGPYKLRLSTWAEKKLQYELEDSLHSEQTQERIKEGLEAAGWRIEDFSVYRNRGTKVEVTLHRPEPS